MSTKRVQDIVNRFVVELVDACEAEAAETIQERLRSVLGDAAKDVMPLRRKTTKGYSVLRPCPIDGCHEVAAPRYGMVCKAHGQSLSREDILMARDKANKPGGIWFDLKPGRLKAV